MLTYRPRGPGGQFIRRKRSRLSAWIGAGEVAIIIAAAIVYGSILLSPVWVPYLRGG